MDPPLKRCPKCGRDLPLTRDSFYRDAHTKDGLTYAYKGCTKARVMAWEQAHPERRAANQRRYRERRKARDAGE